MNYTNHSCLTKTILLIVILLMGIHISVNCQTIDWESINPEQATEITGKINGLNIGGYAYGKMNMQGNNFSGLDECVECINFNCSPFLNQETLTGISYNSMETKPVVVSLTKKLKPTVLRFPGGTFSGWYHFYEFGEDRLYDASAPTIDKGFGMNLGESIHLPLAYDHCKKDSRLLVNQNYIDGYINYVKNIKQDNPYQKITTSYVANLFSHFKFPNIGLPLLFPCTWTCGHQKALTPMDNYDCTQSLNISFEGNESMFNNDIDIYRFELYYKETQDAIEYLVDHLELTTEDELFVELGNEYYDNEGFNSGYSYQKYGMTAQRYANLAELYSERLKCYFNDKVIIKTAMVTKTDRKWHSTNQTQNVNYPGLANMMDQDYTNDGQTLSDVVDAMILHDYYTKSDCLSEGNIEERFECGKEALDEHISGSTGLFSELDIFREDFPDQKIWLTEWSIVGGSDNKNVDYLNTTLYATFVMEYALKMLEYNSMHDNIVEFANHHRIGSDQPWSVVQTIDGDNETAIYRSGAYPLQYLSKLFDFENINYIGNVLKNGNEIHDSKEANVVAFLQNPDDINDESNLILYYTNKTDQAISYNIQDLEIENYTVKSANNSYIKGNHLFSYGEANTTHGRNRFKKGSQLFQNEDLNELGFGEIHNAIEVKESEILDINQEQSIPPFSVGVITLELQLINITNPLPPKTFNVEVSPNPFKNLVKINIESGQPNVILIEIMDLNGRVIKNITQRIQNGENTINIDTLDITSGMYLVSISDENSKTIYKIIK